MAPIRRYLRITSYSVLEVRVYLDNPADSARWLLNPRDPVLPRVLEAVKPLVLPKLREENERNGVGWKGKGKGGTGKRKGVKDLVGTGMFQGSFFGGWMVRSEEIGLKADLGVEWNRRVRSFDLPDGA